MYLSDYELQLAQRRYAELVREVEVDRLARAAKLRPSQDQPARSRLMRLWFFLVVNRLARA